jgi:hypothetical protein
LGPWAKAVRALKRVVRAVSTEVIAAGVTTGTYDVAVRIKSGDKLTIGTPLLA